MNLTVVKMSYLMGLNFYSIIVKASMNEETKKCDYSLYIENDWIEVFSSVEAAVTFAIRSLESPKEE